MPGTLTVHTFYFTAFLIYQSNPARIPGIALTEKIQSVALNEWDIWKEMAHTGVN